MRPRVSRIARADVGRRALPLARSARALACTALLLACAAPAPPADPDGTPATAQTIEIAPRADALRCEADAKPDCADWFRFRVTSDGALRVSVAPIAPAAGGSPSAAPFELAIAEASGTEIGRAKVGPGSPAASIPLAPAEPTEYVAVVTLPAGAGASGYRLTFDAIAQPATAPPAGRVSSWTILEVDPDGGVLIDGGQKDGLRAGLRGRLRDGKRTLGSLVVVDVFEEGARARIDGPLAGEITPDTVAEIEGAPGRR